MKKYFKNHDYNTFSLENVYIDEGDTMICTKLTKYSADVFKRLKLTKKNAEKNASTFVELKESEYECKKSNSQYIEDMDIEEMGIEMSDPIKMFYKTFYDDRNQNQKREYIVTIYGDTTKYFKFEVNEGELDELDKEADYEYDLPKLQRIRTPYSKK